MCDQVKWCTAYNMICREPAKWFGDVVLDDRDKALLTGKRATFIEYSSRSFLRKMYRLKITDSCSDFQGLDWTVENNELCKQYVHSAGGELYGFKKTGPSIWRCMTVNVNIQGAIGAGFLWGFLATQAENIRIFKGPAETCSIHPWDAMILRDCTTNTGTLDDLDAISSRKWDVLVMKMCEDHDCPWIVVSVQDAGEAFRKPLEGCCAGTCTCPGHT